MRPDAICSRWRVREQLPDVFVTDSAALRLDGETVRLLNPIEKNARIDVAIGLTRQLTPRFQQTPCLRGNRLFLRGGRVFRRGFFRRGTEYCRKHLYKEFRVAMT